MDLAALFRNPRTYATPLVLAYVDRYGPMCDPEPPLTCLGWDPLTIAMHLEDDAGPYPASQFDRLLAGITLLTSDRFYKNLPDFIALCNALCGHGLSPHVFDPAEAEEIAWAVTEALLLSPPEEDDEEPFIPDIRLYVGKVLDREGIMTPPDVLALGLRGDKGRLQRVLTQHADDPDLLTLIQTIEEAKTQEIRNTVKEGLRSLLSQIESLELVTGNARALLERLVKGFQE